MKIIYFLGFLSVIGLLFWSARKKFSVSEESLTLKKFFAGLANRATDIIFIGSAIAVALFLVKFFSSAIYQLDNNSITKLVVVLVFLGVIFVPVIILLKKIVGRKEMIFVYGILLLAFALIINAKLAIFPEPKFDLAIRVFIGALFVVWFCSHWADKFQSALALPIGFVVLTAGFLWKMQLRTGGSYIEILKEPVIIVLLVVLFVVIFIFYKKKEWRRRIGYFGIMFPIFVFQIIHGSVVVALLYNGNLSLQDLAYMRKAPRLIERSIQAEDYELSDLRAKVAQLEEKKKDGSLLPSEKDEFPFLCEELLALEREFVQLAAEERCELTKKYRPDKSPFWAFEKLWQETILPEYNNYFKKGGDR